MRTTLSLLLLVLLATVALPVGASDTPALGPTGWWERLINELFDWWAGERIEQFAKTGAEFDPNGIRADSPLQKTGAEADPNG